MATIDFTIPQGSDETRTFNLWTDAAKTQPLSISGYTHATLEVRKTYDAAAPVLTIDQTNGITLLNGSPSQVVITFSAAATSALSFRGDSADWPYSLTITNPTSGAVRRILDGTLTISRAVVR